MVPHDGRAVRRVSVAMVLLALLGGCSPWGRGAGVITLAGPWAFQAGDNLEWAAPEFDSSTWPRLQVPMSWGRQGFDTGFNAPSATSNSCARISRPASRPARAS